MKKGILICITLLASVAGFTQEQVTHFSGRDIETAYLEPVGRIGPAFFYLNTHSIAKINLETFETSQVVSSLTKGVNYVSLVSHERLFYAFMNFPQSEVIINEIDTGSGEVINRFSFPKSSFLSKINDVYYIVRDNSWLRISFDESEIYTEEIFKYDNTGSEGGFLKNRIIEVKNKADVTVKGFWDNHNNFIVTKDIEVGLIGQEFPNHYVFYHRTNFERAFVYNKNTGKETKVEPSTSPGFVRLFEGGQGEIYFLESFEKYFSGELGVLYRMYRLAEDGVKNHVMDVELKDYNYYLSGGTIFGPYSGTPYSNILYFNKHIYFWAGSSKWNSARVKMKMIMINLETQEVITRSLPEEAVKALQFNYPPYGLQLIASGEKITAVTNNEDYVSISYNPGDHKFTLENRKKIGQRSVIAVNDTLNLNFSYPQRIIAEDSNGHLMKVIGDSTFYDANAIGNYFATPGKLIIPDGFNVKTYVYDGEVLRHIPDDINSSYLRLNSAYWTGIKVYNRYLIYAHGLRVDGTTGGDYYAFDSNTNQTEKAFSFDSPYLIHSYARKAKSGEFVLIDLGEGKYVITDFEDYFELILPNVTSGVELIGNYDNKTFLLTWPETSYPYPIYYFNPGSGVVKNTEVKNFGRHFYGRNLFYSFEDRRLIKIDENGNNDTIIGKDETLNVKKISANEVVFLTSREFGKINLTSGDIVKQKVKANSRPLADVFKLNNRSFGILSDGELVQVDFDKGNFNKIANERFGPDWEDTGNKIYLKRYDNSSGVIEAWEFNGTVVRERFSFDVLLHNKSSFSQPTIFNNTDDHWQLWRPADEKVIKLDSILLNNYRSLSYLGETKEVCYFIGFRKSGEYVSHLISINVRSKQVSELLTGGEYFQIFDDRLFISNPEGIWKSNAEGTLMTLETRLKVVALYNPDEGRNFFEFRNNLYFWAKDEKGRTQLYQLTDKTSENTLLPTENATLSFSFYPNPTADYLTISTTAGSREKYKIIVFGTDGKMLSEQNLDLPGKVDLSRLKTGIYLINVRSGKESETFRVVKY